MNRLFNEKMLGYYVSEKVRSEKQTEARKVDCYEIELYATDGTTSVVNGVEYRQRVGNVLVAKPNDIRYSTEHFECYYAHLDSDDAEIRACLDALPSVFHVGGDAGERLIDIFKNLTQLPELSATSRELFIQGQLALLVGTLSEYADRREHSKYERYALAVETVCLKMQNELDLPLTLADLAETANLSPVFFHKVFKDLRGVTPARYLTILRLKKAKELLCNTSKPLSEVAFLCGFGSQSYFNSVFSKEIGKTPKQYRDQNQVII